jgi:enamine deaminase RidA (YjgF/YER057c/UK114 family)
LRRQSQTSRPWEERYGFSRAVRVGNLIDTSVTSPSSPAGEILFPGDVYRQTKVCLEIIRASILELGGSLSDVYRTRIYLAEPARWIEAGEAHAEFFSQIRPTLGWIYMSGFFHPDIAVEVECTAYCGPDSTANS